MSVEACAALVEKGDPDRFLAAMTAPPQARARLFVLYAFNLEIARAPWVSAEPMIGQMRLQFWRDTLDEIDRGVPARAHEVAGPLATVLRETGVGAPALDTMVRARWADLDRAPFADAEALGRYLDDTAGTLMRVSVSALGGGPELDETAGAVGRAQGLAAWLMAVPALEAHGWPAVPQDLDTLIARTRGAIAAARGTRAGPATPALRAGWRAEAVLARAAREPAAIGEGRLGGTEFARRGTLLLRSLAGRW